MIDRRKKLMRLLRVEKLEERSVMDAGLYANAFEPYSLVAQGDNATWGGSCESTSLPRTCITTSPVEVSKFGLGAPDGATDTFSNLPFDSYPSNTFTPKNGLLTLQNGQDEVRRYYDSSGKLQYTPPISFAQQQEIEFRTDFIRPSELLREGDNSVQYKSTLTVNTTGQYTFYLQSFNRMYLKIDTNITNSRAWNDGMLTVSLTAGTEYAIEVMYFYTGYADSTTSIQWEGPNVSRQQFTPSGDIIWRTSAASSNSIVSNFNSQGVTLLFPGFDNPTQRGIISPTAQFSSFKRLRDDDYALRYMTSFVVPTTGEYTFYLNSDNIGSIKLGNDVVVNKTGTSEATGKRTLTAGAVINLELNYVHRTGARSLKFEWSGPNLARQLFTTPNLVSYDYFEGQFNSVGDIASAQSKYSDARFQDPNTFALQWNGQTTVALNNNSSAESVQKALNALTNIGGVGGSVVVSRASNSTKYSFSFGGNIWYRPSLLKVIGREGAKTTAVTKFAITKRDPGSTLSIGNMSRPFILNIPNGNTIPIDNAPFFTPASMIRAAYSDGVFGLSGYLQTPAIGGRFDPVYSQSQYELSNNNANVNVVRSSNGFRVAFTYTNAYKLNALKDSAGNDRPITLFNLAGLNFEAPAGTSATLTGKDGDESNLEFSSVETSMLVSAPYEGGRLTLRLLTDGSTPIFKANLRSGRVDVTSKFEFVSLEIGGVVIPASDSFKMNYDAAAQKFSFAINNLSAESPHPDGTPKAYEVNDDYRSIVQTFDTAKLGPVTLEFNPNRFHSLYTFDDIVTDVHSYGKSEIITAENLSPNDPSSLWYKTPFTIPSYATNTYGNFYALLYTTKLTVPTSGKYTFNSTSAGRQQLKINGTTVFSGDSLWADDSGAIALTAGVEYSLQYLQVNLGAFRTSSSGFRLLMSFESQRSLESNGKNALTFAGSGNINGAFSPFPDSRSYMRGDLDGSFKQAFESAIDRQANLSVDQIKTIKDAAVISVSDYRVTVTGIPYLLRMDGAWTTSYRGPISNPVRLKIPSGTLSITKGVLDPVSALPIDSFEVGQTTIGLDSKIATVYEPIKPSNGGGFKAAFFQRNTYNSDGSVNIPGNTFGVYGNQTQLPLDVAGVSLSGTANLGTATAPGLIVTNGQFVKLTYPVPDVKVNGMVFTGTDVGSTKSLSVNYYPPRGDMPKTYVVQGGAVLKPGGTVIKSDMKANFGGMGSDGLRIFPAKGNTPASFTFSFGVAGTFLAGTQAIMSADGLDGLKLLYDPVSNKYNFQGNGLLDFNPVTPHTPTNLDFTGSKLNVSATIPNGVSNFSPNLLDGSTLNFFFGDRASVNGFVMTPRVAGSGYVTLGPGLSLTSANNILLSPNRKYALTLASDGNITLSNKVTSEILFNANTGKGGANNPNALVGNKLTMQADGNLVLLTATGRIVWSSSTAGNPGAELRLLDTGRIEIVSTTGNVLWSQGSTDRGVPFNPLRVAITNTTETVGGTFTMRLDTSNLYGVMTTTPFAGAKFPTNGFQLDFSPVAGQPSSFAYGGVILDNAGKASLTNTLTLKFATASFDGTSLSQSAVGSETNTIEAINGRLTKAEVIGKQATQIGDVIFQNFTSSFDFKTTPGYWKFAGPGTYFGKPTIVGNADGSGLQVKIGGDRTKGFQLQTLGKIVDPIKPDFSLPDTIEVAGLTIDTRSLLRVEPDLLEGASKKFNLKSNDYQVKVGNTTLVINLNTKLRVSASGVEIISFGATAKADTEFKIGNASFKIVSMNLDYKVDSKTLTIGGEAKFTFKAAKSNVQMSVKLDSLVIKAGSFDSVKVTITGGFEILGLTATAKNLSLEYKSENSEFNISGSLSISTKPQGGVQVIKDLAVTLGSGKDPGIKIVNGSLENLDISLSGTINLFKLSATADKLRVRYKSEENKLQITGSLTVTIAEKFEISASLPGGGLLIDTESGSVQIKGLLLKSEKDIVFGKMTIKDLFVLYSEADNGDVTIGAGGEVALPSGLAVGASFKIINGKLDAISIAFEKNPGILVANGIVNIYRLEVSIKGLTDLSNFEFSGAVKASVGPLVKFDGKSYALADVTGRITITPQNLTLDGDALFVGGKFGTGSFKGVLAWDDVARVTFKSQVRLYPGDVIQGNIDAYADIKGNVDFSAKMGVFIPKGIPLAGGASLGQLNVELRVRPAEEPSASYVKFGFSDIAITAVKIPTFHGNVKIGFDSKVDYGFGARVFIPLPWPLPDIDFSIDVSGTFNLRDADHPSIDILAASSLPGTPDGEILYAASTPLPDGTKIDIYADHDNLGNDGLLIASGLAYKDGTQTFHWNDMAAFANPGDPIYVYAVINDQKHAPVYSDYSPRFNAAVGFIPTILTPPTMSFASGDVVTFSQALGNAIVIGDPRSTTDATSEVEAVFNVGAGTVDLSHVPDRVRYTGQGTSRMVLRGTAKDITAAIDGMTYAQRFANDTSDRLDITVSNLPLESVNGVTKSIALNPNPLQISLIPTQDISSPSTITIGALDESPLSNVEINSLNTDYLTGAKITIIGYEPGKDILDLPKNDEFTTGIDGVFDADTGVLTLTGFDFVEDYEQALRHIIFTTKSATTGKKLSISMGDDEGDRGTVVVPLQIVKGHDQPTLDVGNIGLSYVAGSGPLSLSPNASVNVFDNASIQSISIAFVDGTYSKGEDFLDYTGSQFTGTFDSVNGVLTLTGTGTESQWNAALKQVTYGNSGDVFTEGNRYLQVTVKDNAIENNTVSKLVVIDNSQVTETHSSPTITLSSDTVSMAANEDFQYLDAQLTLTSTSPRILSATVTISANYIQGEDELAISTLWDGMDADFNALTGVLTISGLASPSAYQDALRSVVFIDAAGYRTPGPAGITYTIYDGLSPAAIDTVTLEIAAAPYIDSQLDRVTVYDEGRTSEPIDPTLKIESAGSLSGAIISISGGFQTGEDFLDFTNQNGITGSYDPTTGILTLTGVTTAANYESALESIQYRNSRYNPVAIDRIVSFQVKDGTALSNVSDALISVQPLTVPPVVTLDAPTSYTENGVPVNIAPNFNLTPKDGTAPFLSAPEELYGAQIAIDNYVPGEDILYVATTDNIVGSFDPVEGRIYLTGEASFDEYETVIRSILYQNVSDVPTTASRQISIRLLDSGANGLNNQTLITEVVIGTPDPVTLTSGIASDVHVLVNDQSVSLGLDDLVYTSSMLGTPSLELQFTATALPDDALGHILLADGTRLKLNTAYSISELAGLRFDPELGGMGSGTFTYSVALTDTDTGNRDSGAIQQQVKVFVDGIATTSSSQAFIAQAYRDLSNSNIDATTLATLSNQLDAKLKRVGRSSNGYDDDAQARASLLSDLTSSVSYRTSQLNAMYQKLFARVPTLSELTFQLASLATGNSFEDVRFSLLASNDYFALHDDAGYTSYVNALYQELFGRAPTDSERADSTKSLSTGTPRLKVVTSIGDWTKQTDAVQEAVLSDLLHRDFESIDRLDFDFSSREKLTLSILASDEYYARNSLPSNSTLIRTQATNAYPAVGTLGDINGDKAGGTLIAPQYVLIAAHSVVGIPPGQITFTIGGVKHRIADVIINPGFDPDLVGLEGGNDIAILKLDVPATNIQPMPVTGQSPRLGQSYKLVGFGEHDGDSFGTKRVGSTPPVDQLGLTAFQWTFTSELQNTSDPGDSGSPLLVSVNGVDQLIGIVSGGTSASGGLGDIATNTRVDSYLSWIQSVVSSIQVNDAHDVPSVQLEDTQLFLDENAGPTSIGFEVSASDSVVFSVSTDHPELFKGLRVDYIGESFGNVVFESAVNMRGTAVITLTAYAGGLTTTQTITATFEERNDPPTIDPINPVVLDVSAGPQTIPLKGITAGIGETGNVRLSILGVTPSNMVSAISITQGSGGSSGGASGEAVDPTLSFTPTAGFQGGGSISIEARDAGPDGLFNTADDATTIKSIVVMTTTNKSPKFNTISNQRLLISAGSQLISFAGITDGDGGTQSLRFTIDTTDPSIADLEVRYDDPNHATTGTLSVNPYKAGSSTVTVTATDPGTDGQFGTLDDRSLSQSFVLETVTSLHPWQNPTNPLDVDGDNTVGPFDVLIVVNEINRNGSRTLPNKSTLAAPYFDTNGDDSLDALDALVIINAINRQGGGEGERGPSSMDLAFARSDFSPATMLSDDASQTKDSIDSNVWSDTDWLLNENDLRPNQRGSLKGIRRM